MRAAMRPALLPRLRRGEAPSPRLQAAGTPEVHSFDAFDTLITRCLWRPEDLFLLLGTRLAAEGLATPPPEAFARRRIATEARLRHGVEEVELAAIHAALGAELGWTPEQARAAAAIEAALEHAAIRPIAPTVAALARLQAAGAEVAVLSDTYLDHATLARLLARAGIAVPPERVFASSAHGATKRTGRLFGVAAAALGVAPAHISHRGDHAQSDVAVPRLMGIRAAPFETGAPTRHEAALHAATGAHPPLLRSLLAGSARAARLSAVPETPHDQALFGVGATVAGPLLAGFVLWILQQARDAGVPRIHFVARDGQILLRIAEVLLPRLGWPIACRYLLGSRQAWHLPALQRLDEAALSWLADDAPREPLRSLLARAELAPERIAGPLARHGLAGALDSTVPTHAVRALLGDAETEAEILRAAAARREAALGYLRQEGVIGAEAAMMVDLGWHGRLQRSLQRLVEIGGDGGAPTRLNGLYLALRSRPPGFTAEAMRSFLQEPDVLHRLNPVLLELFCAADHGTVRRYRRRADGGFEAELAAPVDQRVVDWGLHALQGGILAFARELAEAIALEGGQDIARGDAGRWIALLRDGGLAAYQGFRREPDAVEAEAFGAFPHADGQAHEVWGDCAPRIGPLLRLRLGLGLGAAGYAGHWPEASIRRGGGGVAAALFALKRLRRRLAEAAPPPAPAAPAPLSTLPRGTPGSA